MKEMVLAHFQSLFGRIIMMCFEKMKGKYMKEDFYEKLKEFFM